MAITTKQLKTAQIFMALDVPAQRQIIKAAAERGPDAAYDVAVALLHNQPVPPPVVKEVRQKTGDTFLGLPGMHRTAIEQGQHRQQMWDALDPYKGWK